MKHIRIWLKSGAVVEATVDELTVTTDGGAGKAGKIVGITWTNPSDTSIQALAYLDISDIAALTYRDAQ
jgi:hypothetical protein